ncbi:MAG: hypothetical protein V4613_14460 [Bacteroidota bacterium]
MNDQLENRLSMLEKVKTYLTHHLSEFSTVPPVAAAYAELNLVLADILTSAGISQADVTGYTVQKANKRTELKNAILKVSSGFVAWATLGGQLQEAEKANATPAALDKLRDNDIYTYAQYLHTTATPHLADLGNYGVLPADITALNNTAQQFLELILEPRQRIGERSAEHKNMLRLMDKAMLLLTNKLDVLMPIFRTTHPTLYDAYLYARSIDDTGTPTPPHYEAQVPANTLQPVATLPYKGSRTFKLSNMGPTNLILSLSTTPDSIQGTYETIAPDGVITRTTSNLNPDINATHLLVQNTEPEMGSYKIWVKE